MPLQKTPSPIGRTNIGQNIPRDLDLLHAAIKESKPFYTPIKLNMIANIQLAQGNISGSEAILAIARQRMVNADVDWYVSNNFHLALYHINNKNKFCKVLIIFAILYDSLL